MIGEKANGGEAGIRTLGRVLKPYNGLANRRLKPLGHLTADLQVYVNSAFRVTLVAERRGPVDGHRQGSGRAIFVERHASRPETVGQRLSVEELHHEVVGAVHRADVVDGQMCR